VDYARFDFLVVGERLFAGEITVYPGGGLDNATKFAAYNDALNPGWDLRQSWFLSTPTRGWRECYRRALARQLGD
jgi:hypothetical protein